MDIIEQLGLDFQDVDTSLTETKKQKITYPYIYITDSSDIELKYLRKVLPKGDIPLMLKLDREFALICHTDICLNTIKHLSRYKERNIWVRPEKGVTTSIVELLPFLLLE